MTLSDYMEKAGLDSFQVARKLKCSEGAVRKWVYGERMPRADMLRAIYELSGGKVTANDFVGLSK